MKMLFLLGGRDLEMVTIKDILDRHGVMYVDKKLSWGAKLSEYREYLDFDGVIYGIELIEDREPPKNYIAIDHHNEKFHQKSSLEQVAEILDLQLTRWQKLVSANDKGYIPQMQKLHATDDEIKKIRQEDRSAQGITAQEEEVAKQEIQNLQKLGNIYLLKTTLQHFSPLVDRIDKRDLIVYNDETISVFSSNIQMLIDSFYNELNSNLCYYGGDPLGYFGFTKEYCKQEKIDKTLKRIIEMINKTEKQLYSYHAFMFPFTFENQKISDKWICKKFSITTQKDYNEYFYFYKHVRDALFDTKEGESISQYYEYIDQEGSFTIEANSCSYELEIDTISLRVFNTNVALISFHLLNSRYKDPQDILAINDFGRRVYPQFLGEHFTNETKNAFLAKSITINQPKVGVLTEDFSRFDALKNLKSDMSLPPSYIKHYLDDSFESYEQIIDDRMFVLSLYLSQSKANCLGRIEDDRYIYEEDDFWYKYIFVDANMKSSQSKYMTKKLIKESTYDRWVGYGTLYGVSRYSFVAISSGEFGKEVIFTHMKTIYFQIFTLLLAYRASIISFSKRIQEVSKKDDADITQKAQELYKSYLNFLNGLYFKELTAQDQGIELYNKALNIMNIEHYLKDLDHEINELHSYVEMVEDKKESKKINDLTALGIIFLPATLIVGIFGMNIFPKGFLENIGGWVVSFGLMIGTTWWLVKNHNIPFKKFIFGAKKEKKE
ncbi:MAG TPA: hypothetical protein EYH11_07760 [Sulfurimonas autotrophica]|nr:hypothetical protein [Sulfurimonas autotrophica]